MAIRFTIPGGEVIPGRRFNYPPIAAPQTQTNIKGFAIKGSYDRGPVVLAHLSTEYNRTTIDLNSSFISPGRANSDMPLSYFRLTSNNAGAYTVEGVENAFFATAESDYGVKLHRGEERLILDETARPDTPLMKRLFHNAHFFGVPDIYRLRDIVADGDNFAVDLINEKTRVGVTYNGTPGAMKVGYLKVQSGYQGYDFDPDGQRFNPAVETLLKGVADVYEISTESLERLILERLGFIQQATIDATSDVGDWSGVTNRLQGPTRQLPG